MMKFFKIPLAALLSGCSFLWQSPAVPTIPLPVLSPPGGVVLQGGLITLSVPDGAPAVFRYTLDGSLPTGESPSGERISISEPVKLRVKAYRSGWNPSAVAEASYSPGAFSGAFEAEFRYVPGESDPPVRKVELRLRDKEGQVVLESPLAEGQGYWRLQTDLLPTRSLAAEAWAEGLDGTILPLEAGLSSFFSGDGNDVVDLRRRAEIPRNAVLVEGAGFIYALGGTGASGQASEKVYRAPLRDNGTLGNWEEDTSLPAPWSSGAGYSLGGWVHGMGGAGISGWMAPVGSDGTLGFSGAAGKKWEKSRISLPEFRSGGHVEVLGDRILWSGGFLAGGEPAPVWTARQWKDGQVSSWYRNLPVPQVPREEPMLILPSGTLRTGQEGQLEYFYDFSVPQARLPRIFPGGGIITARTRLKADIRPGDLLRFTRALGQDPAEPDETSEVFSPQTPPQPVDREVFLWKSFRPGGRPSPVIRTAWRVRSSSLFVLLAGSLQPTPEPGTSRTVTLEEKYSDGSSSPVGAVTYSLTLPEEKIVEFRWTAIGEDAGGDAVPVYLTLLEEDLQLPALDLEAGLIQERPPGVPVGARLPAGKYFARFERLDGENGGIFTLNTQFRQM